MTKIMALILVCCMVLPMIPASAGGSWYPLRPTKGCVRITNADQLVLETEIEDLMDRYHYVIGNISIYEVA